MGMGRFMSAAAYGILDEGRHLGEFVGAPEFA